MHRIPRLVSILKESRSDIIGLQEATVSFLTALLQEDWVRNNYYISDNGTTIDIWTSSSSQLILTHYKRNWKLVANWFRSSPSRQETIRSFFAGSVTKQIGFDWYFVALYLLYTYATNGAAAGEFSISEGCKRLFVPVVHLTSSLNANAQKKVSNHFSLI